MYRTVIRCIVVLGVMHFILGIISIVVGIISTKRAEVWLAHSVSPIWSGACFVICGLTAFTCARKRTAYMIMVFTSMSVVALITGIINIQLLRLGLVDRTTDGKIYLKKEKNILLITGLSAAAMESVICIVSSIVSCRLAKQVKNELMQHRVDEPFTIHVCNGEKDLVIVPRQQKDHCNKFTNLKDIDGK